VCLPLALPLPEEEEEVEEEMEMPAVAANLTNEMLLLLLLHMLYCCWSGWMDGWMDQSGGCPAQFLGLLLSCSPPPPWNLPFSLHCIAALRRIIC
jgi:hypothetical protein